MYDLQVYLKTGAATMFSFKDKDKARFFLKNWEESEDPKFKIVDEFGKEACWHREAVYGVAVGDIEGKLQAEIEVAQLVGRYQAKADMAARAAPQLHVIKP